MPHARAIARLTATARRLMGLGALLLVLQAAGVLDGASLLVLGSDECCATECDAASNAEHCLPGCDACACVHGPRPLAAASSTDALPGVSASSDARRAGHLSGPPDQPDPHAIFQPPRR